MDVLTGYVAIAVNYRLLRGDSNRWPAQLDDVQLAVRWLRANSTKDNLDPNRIGAFGHSAGAQLAALLGMEDFCMARRTTSFRWHRRRNSSTNCKRPEFPSA